MTLLLAREELQDLAGSKLRARVTAWLTTNRWAHEVGLDGWPKVSRNYAEAKLSGARAPMPPPANAPNFDALRQRA